MLNRVMYWGGCIVLLIVGIVGLALTSPIPGIG